MANFSSTYPSTRPVFNADFSNAGRLDPRITFSRSDTPPTYAAPSAVHYWSNEKSLSSENLLLQSSDFDTSWTANGLNGTPTGGQADPSGGTDGFTLVESSGAGERWLQQAVSGSGTPTLTVYAKQNSGTRYLYLTIWNSVSNFEVALFDLAGGAAALYSGGSSSFTGVTATQTASGNGFYKCTLKASGTVNLVYVGVDDSSTITGYNTAYGVKSYTGNGSSIDIAFASLTTTGATDYRPTTTQIHREYAPTLKSVSYAGQPRFEYSPTDSASEVMGQSRGLLIEGSSTNLNPYSDSIASWNSVVQLSVDSNAAIGPVGSLSADLLRPTTNVSSHYARSVGITVSSGTSYTMSGYFKSVNGYRIRLVALRTTAPYTSALESEFTLDGDGSVTSTAGSGTIESVGNGWYFCTATGTTATTSVWIQLQTANASGVGSVAGDGYSGILCSGVQFELGSFASSLISTSGSQATRAADSASLVTADIGYTGGPVTVVAEFEAKSGTVQYLGVLSNTSSGGMYSNYGNLYQDAGNVFRIHVTGSGGAADTIGAAAVASSAGRRKIAARYENDNFGLCVDGGSVATDTAGTLPVFNKLDVGSYADGGSVNSTIKRIAIYSEALSDTNLISLTK